MQRKQRWMRTGWGVFVIVCVQIAKAQVVWLTAQVVDYRTNQALGASWRWTDSTGHVLITASVPSNGFSGYIPTRVRWLHLDAPGYRSLRLPVRWLNLPADSLRFRVVLPVVPVDKPMTDQPYFQSEQKPLQLTQKTPNRQLVSATFRVLDVLTGQPVRAEVCLFSTRNYRRTCYPASEVIHSPLLQPDIIALEVKAPGYQLYLGNLVLDKAKTEFALTYTVRLNPMPTTLMVSMPGELPFDDITLIPLGNNKLLMPSTTSFCWTATPGKHQLSVRLRDRNVQIDTIILESGINGYAVTSQMTLNSHLSTLCDVIYFPQSSYELSALTRSQLDRLAARMRQESAQTLLLVGHTDSVGNSQLNLILSEFRAKVIRTYLLQRGIQAERIQIKAVGGRQPMFPNDSELNRSRNRRVDVYLN